MQQLLPLIIIIQAELHRSTVTVKKQTPIIIRYINFIYNYILTIAN